MALMDARQRVGRGSSAAKVDPIEELDELLLRMFSLVEEGLTAATEAFLTGNRTVASRVVAADRELDGLQRKLECGVEDCLREPASLDGNSMRHLVSLLRIAPELERSGDLIEYIALRTPQRLATMLRPEARSLLEAMGRLASTMWWRASDAYQERSPDALATLIALDRELDELQMRMTAELADSGISVAVAIEMGLVNRFYERLGDHAVNVTRRLRYLAGP